MQCLKCRVFVPEELMIQHAIIHNPEAMLFEYSKIESLYLTNKLVKHTYYIRPNLRIEIMLPQNSTQDEMNRLSKAIRTFVLIE